LIWYFLLKSSSNFSVGKCLAPVMIQVGADELLLSDSRSMIKVFERDGVTHKYKEWENLWHVFQLDGEMEESTKSFEMFRDFLNSYIGTKV